MRGIYRILNMKTGDSYVGATKKLETRFYEHYRKLKAGVHYNARMQADWNAQNGKGFAFEILEECSKGDLAQRELHYITLISTYNILRGHPFSPKAFVWTEERKQKQTVRQTGRKLSDETKHRISDSLRKRAQS